MKPPRGYAAPPNQVCRLHKSLSGFKQASCQWYSKFSSALLSFGFTQSRADYILFLYTRDDTFMALLVYADDIIIAGSHLFLIDSLQLFLNIYFKIKSLGDLRYFLGQKSHFPIIVCIFINTNMRWIFWLIVGSLVLVLSPCPWTKIFISTNIMGHACLMLLFFVGQLDVCST